jgi:hypothetical protein
LRLCSHVGNLESHLGLHLTIQTFNAEEHSGFRKAGRKRALVLRFSQGELENRELIRCKRRTITILDRPTLMKLTNGSYGVAESEYKRRFEGKTQ